MSVPSASSSYRGTWLVTTARERFDKLEKRQQSDIKRKFYQIDTNGSQEVDVDELETFCKQMGFNWSRGEVEHLLSIFDTNGNHRLDVNEGCALLYFICSPGWYPCDGCGDLIQDASCKACRTCFQQNARVDRFNLRMYCQKCNSKGARCANHPGHQLQRMDNEWWLSPHLWTVKMPAGSTGSGIPAKPSQPAAARASTRTHATPPHPSTAQHPSTHPHHPPPEAAYVPPQHPPPGHDAFSHGPHGPHPWASQQPSAYPFAPPGADYNGQYPQPPPGCFPAYAPSYHPPPQSGYPTAYPPHVASTDGDLQGLASEERRKKWIKIAAATGKLAFELGLALLGAGVFTL